jgi:phosphopantothenoylcysteine decarboxylase/phosphopantothenate--cysteine ligase
MAETTIMLGVTGCIAAYKACELARALDKDGYRVKPVMTEAATRFVGPLTLRTLTGEQVASSLWDDPGTSPVHHISLAEEADVMVIAPCTANVIAKLAHGRADDILTTTALATEAPLVIAPAMNTHMWQAEATVANVATLRERGVQFVEPGSGELACGDVGEGRLADVDQIARAVRAAAEHTRSLAGVRMLVTAGPTYEPIDPVRFIGNPSSGKTGYLIAEEAARRGADVVLVSGPTSLPDPFGVTTVRVTTAIEMEAAVLEAYTTSGVVIATAAVSDFRPATVAENKMKKDDAPSTIELERNPDILARLGKDKGERVLVGFAAETESVVENAREKLATKRLDLVVANDVSVPGQGFGSDLNAVTFVEHDGEEVVGAEHKRELAARLLDKVGMLLEER